MINVNLLPQALRPVRRSTLPYLAVAISGVVVVLTLASIFGANTAQVVGKENRLTELQEDLESARAAATKVRELEAHQAKIAAKSNAIKVITSDRIAWSEQLYYLAKLMPKDIWLKDIEVEDKTRKKIVDSSDAKEGEPKTKTVVVPYQSLKLVGYAVSREKEMGVNLVGELVRVIEDDDDFGKYFKDPTPRLVKDEDFGNVHVKEFEINCEIVIPTGKETTEQ